MSEDIIAKTVGIVKRVSRLFLPPQL